MKTVAAAVSAVFVAAVADCGLACRIGGVLLPG